MAWEYANAGQVLLLIVRAARAGCAQPLIGYVGVERFDVLLVEDEQHLLQKDLAWTERSPVRIEGAHVQQRSTRLAQVQILRDQRTVHPQFPDACAMIARQVDDRLDEEVLETRELLHSW